MRRSPSGSRCRSRTRSDDAALARDRGYPLPDQHAHHAQGASLMPGMLTADEMAKLAAATGTEFDRLFLAFMIKHHEGALVMVKELFARRAADRSPR